MQCSECRSDTVSFAVPAELSEYAPGGGSAAAICTSCLNVQPAESVEGDGDLTRVSEAFAVDEASAVEMALVVGLLSSLALNRSKIETLLERIEDRGTDPMLVLEELEGDGGLKPSVAIGRRRNQLEQLMG
ncbi:DUF6276 family protein [Haloarchaeobius sp. HRN-SO-5]|uniref:DUF6276 family protein n=1 Tax=Haloarchaeobius sp. HRN-SO-5 TaxID=3446118 RepID=UPI003EBEE4C5